ncbi:MAG: hypothetical protein HY286_13985 [Planctomycetes bacterium]|nr:hypothetical protein [Planctomycetota bacterium]
MTESSEISANPPVDEGIDIAMLKSAVEQSTPAGEAWFVIGGDDLVLSVMTSAADAGVLVSRIDGADASKVAPGSLVIVELPGGDSETIVVEAANHGAIVVAVLDQPTIEWFTKVIKSGACDVVAGVPTPEIVSSRCKKWKSRIAEAKKGG